MNSIVGAMVGRIYMDDKHLTLITDKGEFSFAVDEEADASTFFCDFYGANHLFGNRIVGIKEIPVTSRNREYRGKLPKYRSMMKNFQLRVTQELGTPMPIIHGYEIAVKGRDGTVQTSIFSFQGYWEPDIQPTLVETSEHVTDEQYRILKPKFRISPRQ